MRDIHFHDGTDDELLKEEPALPVKKKRRKRRHKNEYKDVYYYRALRFKRANYTVRVICVVALAAILVGCYFFTHNTPYEEAGCNSYVGVIQNGQWYRLITSMFLHGGQTHLINNTVSLIVIGASYTRKHYLFEFNFVYFFGGAMGNLCSIVYHGYLRDETYTASIGASGAIFAVLGALVIHTLLREKGFNRFGALIYTLVVLFASAENISADNAAHLCGLVSGILLETVIIIIRIKSGNKDEGEEELL